METVAVKQGIWKLEQDDQTKVVRLYRYDEVVGEWQKDELMTWEEMYEMMLHESYERRGDR